MPGTAMPPGLLLLRPLEALYRRQVTPSGGRRRSGNGRCQLSVPVIVVGNVTLGGTGKSPLVAWLARYLSRAGLSSRAFSPVAMAAQRRLSAAGR